MLDKDKYKYLLLETKKQGGLFSIFIYGRFSIFFAIFFDKIKLSPNKVTLIGFFFTVLSAILFTQLDMGSIIFGLIFFNLGKIFDYADGQLALLQNKKTKLGAFLDPFLDRIGDISVLAALAYSYCINSDACLVIYIFILWLISLYLGLILDNAIVMSAKKANMRTGVDNLRRLRYFFPQNIRKYIRWDGGFSAFLTSVIVAWGNIPLLLIICFLIIFVPHIPIFFEVLRVLKLNNEK